MRKQETRLRSHEENKATSLQMERNAKMRRRARAIRCEYSNTEVMIDDLKNAGNAARRASAALGRR